MADEADTIIDDTADTGADTAADKGADDADKGGADKGAEDKSGDWRSRMAGDDADLSKFLGRYQSEAAALKAFKGIHADIRSGKYIKPLGEDATDEEKAAYRKQLGVPDEPKGYLDSLPDGLVVGEDDRPFVDVFLGKMHEAGAPPGLTAAALESYYHIVEEQATAEAETVATAKVQGEELLREEWGKDYRRNINATNAYLETLPEGVKDALTDSRASDGVPLGSKPEVIKWLAALALEANPLATVVPGAGANQASAIADEIAQIEKTMRENRSAYNRDEKMQARYRELVSARERLPK